MCMDGIRCANVTAWNTFRIAVENSRCRVFHLKDDGRDLFCQIG